MRITIRPWRHQEKCPQCGVKFNSELFCDEHPWMKPERVYFDLGFTGAERAYINEDLDGDPLSLEKAKRMRDRIIQDAELCHNDVDARRLVMRNYVPRDRKKARFGAVVEKYIEWMEKRVELGKMARTTLKNRSGILRRHYERFKDVDVASITEGVVEEWIDQDLGRFRGSSQATITTALRLVLVYAKKQGLLTELPPRVGVEVERPVHQWATWEQQQAILEHIPEVHRPIFQFAVTLGWRINEIRAVRVGDVDFENNTVRVFGAMDGSVYRPSPKNRKRKGEAYPLELVADVVRAAMKDRVTSADDFLFIHTPPCGRHTKKRRQYSHQTLVNIFKAAAGKVGLGGLRLNEFVRHSLAGQLMDAGVPVERVAEVLGNTRPMVMGFYAEVTADRKKGTLLQLLRGATGGESVANGGKRNKRENES